MCLSSVTWLCVRSRCVDCDSVGYNRDTPWHEPRSCRSRAAADSGVEEPCMGHGPCVGTQFRSLLWDAIPLRSTHPHPALPWSSTPCADRAGGKMITSGLAACNGRLRYAVGGGSGGLMGCVVTHSGAKMTSYGPGPQDVVGGWGCSCGSRAPAQRSFRLAVWSSCSTAR